VSGVWDEPLCLISPLSTIYRRRRRAVRRGCRRCSPVPLRLCLLCLSLTIFNPDPDPNPDPNPDPDQLQVCSRQKIGVRESTTRTTCDSVNPYSYFGVWLRVQGLTRSFRRPAIWALNCGRLRSSYTCWRLALSFIGWSTTIVRQLYSLNSPVFGTILLFETIWYLLVEMYSKTRSKNFC
jgi:hypothetical protein